MTRRIRNTFCSYISLLGVYSFGHCARVGRISNSFFGHSKIRKTSHPSTAAKGMNNEQVDIGPTLPRSFMIIILLSVYQYHYYFANAWIFTMGTALQNALYRECSGVDTWFHSFVLAFQGMLCCPLSRNDGGLRTGVQICMSKLSLKNAVNACQPVKQTALVLWFQWKNEMNTYNMFLKKR